MRLGGCGTARRKMRQVTERATHMNPTLHLCTPSHDGHDGHTRVAPTRGHNDSRPPARSLLQADSSRLQLRSRVPLCLGCCVHCPRSAQRDLVRRGAAFAHWRGLSTALPAQDAAERAATHACRARWVPLWCRHGALSAPALRLYPCVVPGLSACCRERCSAPVAAFCALSSRPSYGDGGWRLLRRDGDGSGDDDTSSDRTFAVIAARRSTP